MNTASRVVPVGMMFRWVRQEMSLSQREAARRLDITSVHLCNVERGTAEPSQTLIGRFSETFRVDPYVLAWCYDESQLTRNELRKRAIRGLVADILRQANIHSGMGPSNKRVNAFFEQERF